MSSEEEDLQSPKELLVLVTTIPVTIRMTTTSESWLLTPALAQESQYEYKPPHEMGTHPRHREEKTGWEEHFTCMKKAQNQLIQVVDDTSMGILAMFAQLVQAEICLQQQQQQVSQQPSPLHHDPRTSR
ncbi:UNVERIFIED_CONTAM: hypothetical protein K2H54_061455 [Gekko kuhli]